MLLELKITILFTQFKSNDDIIKMDDSTDHPTTLTQQNNQLIDRLQHPKVAYQTAKEAARALFWTKRHNIGTPYEAANRKLHVYHDGDVNCFHIGQ